MSCMHPNDSVSFRARPFGKILARPRSRFQPGPSLNPAWTRSGPSLGVAHWGTREIPKRPTSLLILPGVGIGFWPAKVAEGALPTPHPTLPGGKATVLCPNALHGEAQVVIGVAPGLQGQKAMVSSWAAKGCMLEVQGLKRGSRWALEEECHSRLEAYGRYHAAKQ